MSILEKALVLSGQRVLFIVCHSRSNRLKGSACCPEVSERVWNLPSLCSPSVDRNLRVPSGDLRGLSHWELSSTISSDLPFPKKGLSSETPKSSPAPPSRTCGSQSGTCMSNFNSAQASPTFPESTSSYITGLWMCVQHAQNMGWPQSTARQGRWLLDVGGLQGCCCNLLLGPGPQTSVMNTAHHWVSFLLLSTFVLKWEAVMGEQRCTVSDHSECDILDLSTGFTSICICVMYAVCACVNVRMY